MMKNLIAITCFVVALVSCKTLEEDTRLDLELVNYGGTPLEQFMRYTDWTSPKQTFTIEQSSVTNLVMSCEGRTYTFKKF